MLNLLKNAYERSPTSLKRLYAAIPFSIRMGRAYRETRRFLAESGKWPRRRLADYQNERLQKLIQHAFENVPYYHRTFVERGLKPEDVRTVADLRKLPFLTREDIRSHSGEMTARNIAPRTTYISNTGGTTGEPLSLRINNSAYGTEWAFMLDQWARIGYDASCRKVGLREFGYDGKAGWHYDPIYNELRLSPMLLNDDSVQGFVDATRRFGATFMFGYPSAITIFAQCLKRRALSIDGLAGILAGSENLHDWQRDLFNSVFDCRVFSWYGQTEKVILAGECEQSSLYHVYPQYGCTELVAEDGSVINQPGVSGELVGTGFLNSAMPLIRYRTGDYAAYAEGPCPCGRAYALIAGIEGRRKQEVFVGKDGRLIPATAFFASSVWEIFTNVRAYQFEQAEPGCAVLKVVPAGAYGAEDAQRLMTTMKGCGSEFLSFTVVRVAEIQRTPRGKIPFLIQKIDLKQLNSTGVTLNSAGK